MWHIILLNNLPHCNKKQKKIKKKQYATKRSRFLCRRFEYLLYLKKKSLRFCIGKKLGPNFNYFKIKTSS